MCFPVKNASEASGFKLARQLLTPSLDLIIRSESVSGSGLCSPRTGLFLLTAHSGFKIVKASSNRGKYGSFWLDFSTFSTPPTYISSMDSSAPENSAAYLLIFLLYSVYKTWCYRSAKPRI